jgi:hypothetical protein
MNYTNLVNELNKASLFDLYRLRIAISNELTNPARILAIKQKLYIGMELSYFYHAENRSIKAKLLELKQKNVVILDSEKQKRFVIPYYMLNIDSIQTSIHENSDALTINNLKVGDCVGFNKDGKDIIGIINRLNHKTVTLAANSGARWRVAYSYLYRIHDVEIVAESLLKISTMLAIKR